MGRVPIPMTERRQLVVDTVAAPPEASRASAVRRLTVRVLKVAVALAVAGFLVYGVVNNWNAVRHTWMTLSWVSLVLSSGIAALGMLAMVMAWSACLRDLDHSVPFVDAARINLVGALGKYLPGSVWAYVMQMEFGRRAGLPRSRALLASLVTVCLSSTTALVLGLLALPSLLAGSSAHSAYQSTIRYTLVVLAVVTPIAVICAIPSVLTWLIRQFLRVVRRPPPTRKLSRSGVLQVAGWATVAWICWGIHLWLLVNSHASPGIDGLFELIGAFALAVTIGVFALFAPSGLGVREAVVVAVLVPLLPAGDGIGVALGIALASRLLLTVVDVMMAALAALAGVWHDRRTRALDRTADEVPVGSGAGLSAADATPAP